MDINDTKDNNIDSVQSMRQEAVLVLQVRTKIACIKILVFRLKLY